MTRVTYVLRAMAWHRITLVSLAALLVLVFYWDQRLSTDHSKEGTEDSFGGISFLLTQLLYLDLLVRARSHTSPPLPLSQSLMSAKQNETCLGRAGRQVAKQDNAGGLRLPKWQDCPFCNMNLSVFFLFLINMFCSFFSPVCLLIYLF